MSKTLYTSSSLFTVVWEQLREEGKVPEDLLDYAVPTEDFFEFRDYGFDVLGKINYGGSEGIYVDLYFKGEIGDPQHRKGGEIGTIKTLDTSDDAFRKMAVLMADFQIAATRFINRHLDDFTWTGFDIDYYQYGKEERVYGVTCKGYQNVAEAVNEARRTLKASREKYRYAYALVTDNRTGKTETIGAYNKAELQYFEIWLQENPDVPGGIFDFDMVIRGLREPTIEEAEEFLKDIRENWAGPEHVLHVVRVEVISYRNAERDFALPTEDKWPIFGL